MYASHRHQYRDRDGAIRLRAILADHVIYTTMMTGPVPRVPLPTLTSWYVFSSRQTCPLYSHLVRAKAHRANSFNRRTDIRQGSRRRWQTSSTKYDSNAITEKRRCLG